MNDDYALTDYERSIFSNVADHGCHVTYVFDNEDTDFVPFCYSAGFTKTVGQGEVIAFGLPMDVMKFMINQTLRQCREGMVLEDGKHISNLLEGFDVVARLVWPEYIEREYFNSAMWFHRCEFGSDLEQAYQLVWPGAVNGLFPWEEGCSQDVIDLQPPLYEARMVH
ncbi:MAG: DUF4262 domain-containing protein [Novosphingobium sp.]